MAGISLGPIGSATMKTRMLSSAPSLAKQLSNAAVRFVPRRRSSAKLIGVTLRASRGACVLHRSGRLAVEVCSLELNTAGGLDHLFAAIVTTAAGALAAPLQAPLQLRAEPVAPPQGAGPASTAGVLTVTETRIQVTFFLLLHLLIRRSASRGIGSTSLLPLALDTVRRRWA